MPDHVAEVTVKTDYKRQLYVIRYPDGHVTCYGWDQVAEEIERMHLAFGELDIPPITRGSVEAYDMLANLRDRARRHYEETGEQCVANLTPGLSGLEGHRVEVVDFTGETRRFIVGKSTGWLPIHLELPRRNSSGGGPCDPEGYESVRDLGPVR